MVVDISAGKGEPRSGDSQNDSEVEQRTAICSDNADINPAPSQQGTKKPNWVDKGALAALWLAFAAAVYAGCEAKRLADLTDTMIIEARDTAKRQLRAHVLYDGASINLRKTTAAIAVRFKNSGTTPAYETTYWWNVKAFTPTEVGKLEFFDTDKISLDIGSGGALDTNDREIPLGDIEEARKGNKIIYIWGLIKYRDVFQRCQFASFALRSSIKIDVEDWVLRGFTNGSTIVSDGPDKRCGKDDKSPDLPPTIFLPPK